MRTRLLIGIIVVILVVILGVVFVNIASNNIKLPFSPQPKSTVTIDGHTFHVTVASSEKDKEVGLSSISSLPKDQGMVFTFDHPDFYAFWMRNMKFPIDIIYIANRKIVTIVSNVAAPSSDSSSSPIYKPKQPADTVLEINAGLSNQYHFAAGDNVSLSL